MANPINSFGPGGAQPTRPTSPRPAAEGAPKTSADSFSVTTSYSLNASPLSYSAVTYGKPVAPPPPPAVEVSPSTDPEKAVLSLRLEVDKKLLEPDPVTGQAPIEHLEPDFVPHDAKGKNAPTVLAAIADPDVPDGWVPKTTVTLVERAIDTPTLEQTHRPTMVPNDAYIMSPGQLQDFGKGHHDSGVAEGRKLGYQDGVKAAVPPGFQAKIADSEAGAKLEGTQNRYATMATMFGSSSAALGMAHNIGVPAAYAALLGPAVAGLQVFGPSGSLATMSKIENNRAALIAAVRADHPEGDISKIAIDVNPATQGEVTLQQAMESMDAQKTVQKMKIATAALLAGAGVATVAGMAPLAAGLAIGSMINPVLDQWPQMGQLGAMRDRKAELKQMAADGKTSVEVQVPVFAPDGTPRGVQAQEVPIEQAIQHISTQQKNVALAITQGVATAGAVVAMGLGAPVMVAIGVSIGAPMLARAALFPTETWDKLKSIPGHVWDGMRAVGNAVARRLGFGKDDAGGAGPTRPLSAAEKQFDKALSDISKADPQLGKQLEATLGKLNKVPQNEADQKAALEAGVEHQELLQQLAAQHPELAARFHQGVEAVAAEAREAHEAAQFEAAHEKVEAAVSSDFAQSLLGSERVARVTGGDRELGEGVIRMMAQAQLLGSDGVYQQMLQQAPTDKDAARQLEVYRAVEAELSARSAQQNPAA